MYNETFVQTLSTMYIHDEYNEISKLFQHNTSRKVFLQTLSTTCKLFQRCKFLNVVYRVENFNANSFNVVSSCRVDNHMNDE